MDHDPLEDDSMDAGGTDLTDRLTGPKRPRSTGEPPLTPARYTASFKKKRKMTKAKTDVATLDRIWSTAPASSNDDDYHDAATITPPAPTSAKGLITMLHQRLPGLQHFNLTSNINKGKLPNEYVVLGLKIGTNTAQTQNISTTLSITDPLSSSYRTIPNNLQSCPGDRGWLSAGSVPPQANHHL